MEKFLLMVSGGIDSTYMLYHFLTKTDCPLHVHHISIRYPHLRRWELEDPAVERIVDYCQTHYRTFEYSQSRFDMEAMRLVGWDSDLQLLVAAKLGPNLSDGKVTLVRGRCVDDLQEAQVQQRINNNTMENLWRSLRESVIEGERLNPDILLPLVDMGITKKMIMKQLPKALLRLCWSCRRPDFSEETPKPCGFCTPCRQNRLLLEEMGRTIEFSNLYRGEVFQGA